MGRDAVIERAASAIAGPSRTVLAYGPSGIGKSRVVQAVTERLAADGWCVLSASGNTALSAVPLGALAPVLAGDPVGMATAAGDPVALYAAASAAVRDLAGGRRTVLAVDDVSAVDSVSVALIAQLVEAGTLRLIATVREADPLPDALLSLAASGDAVRLEIAALDVDQVSELLTRVLGGPVAHRAAVELHGVSHGNPLFLRELAIGAAGAASLVCADGLWQLVGEPVGTPALRDLIRARLRQLDDDERDAVERLALCEPLAFDEFTRPGAPEALAELEMHGLIRVDESAARMRVWLAHPHYASAVRDSIPRLRALSLLVEQADVVASRPMSAGDELRVAIWRLDAGGPPTPGSSPARRRWRAWHTTAAPPSGSRPPRSRPAPTTRRRCSCTANSCGRSAEPRRRSRRSNAPSGARDPTPPPRNSSRPSARPAPTCSAATRWAVRAASHCWNPCRVPSRARRRRSRSARRCSS
ncbi:AAA family ATPase [Agromyces bauzanensis]